MTGRTSGTLRQEDLRQRIAYVPQKAWLFSGTVAENLRHGNPQAGEEDLRHALAVAQAGLCRTACPGDSRLRVEQGGRNFSGGQKQRLAIARALTKRADLYIFRRQLLRPGLSRPTRPCAGPWRQEVAGSAVLIIAQRVSTIRPRRPDHCPGGRQGGGHRHAMRSCWRPARSTGRLPNPKGKEGES